jgi:hypothetical protein
MVATTGRGIYKRETNTAHTYRSAPLINLTFERSRQPYLPPTPALHCNFSWYVLISYALLTKFLGSSFFPRNVYTIYAPFE